MGSYRMRMYKRRLWEQRARIVLIGTSIWLLAALIVVFAVEVTR